MVAHFEIEPGQCFFDQWEGIEFADFRFQTVYRVINPHGLDPLIISSIVVILIDIDMHLGGVLINRGREFIVHIGKADGNDNGNQKDPFVSPEFEQYRFEIEPCGFF